MGLSILPIGALTRYPTVHNAGQGITFMSGNYKKYGFVCQFKLTDT